MSTWFPWFNTVHVWLFEQLVQPLLFATGNMALAEDAFDGLEWTLLGAIEISFLALVLRTIERRWPLEPLTDRRAVRTDIIYTALHRLGAFGLITFALLSAQRDELAAWLHFNGITPFNLEQLWPGVTDIPLISFMLYLLVLDFVDYWVHRAQHRFGWWWALHALHHSQRQMTLWTDDRNHLLDDLLRDVIAATVALFIGVAPGQFVLLVIFTRVQQSLQHANLRCSFGRWGEKIMVSPRFHRLHHAIGFGHEGVARGCNFAVLFPIWDMLFRTADFHHAYLATGIRDQLNGRDYGQGFWAQQWLGLKRLFRYG
ncbi:MAG: sterol desaturase family protein [Burkholderiaceae bacterium]|nr:MAG: sterol desaturase family protein [Burkholderiaceae bacterium]